LTFPALERMSILVGRNGDSLYELGHLANYVFDRDRGAWGRHGGDCRSQRKSTPDLDKDLLGPHEHAPDLKFTSPLGSPLAKPNFVARKTPPRFPVSLNLCRKRAGGKGEGRERSRGLRFTCTYHFAVRSSLLASAVHLSS
jgi:hypothetical protein